VKTVQEPFSLTLTYTYDAANNRTVFQDSKGGLETFAYDAANRLTSVKFTNSLATVGFDFVYDARDSITKLTRYGNINGTATVGWTSFTYDTRGRLTNEQHRDSSNTSLNNTTFTYDNFDRLTTKKVDGTTTTYSYDNTNQLTSDGTRNYAYDANGNRNSAGYTTGTGNQTTNDGTWTYTYDNEGNLSKKSKGASLETWNYSYDQQNHLVTVEKHATDGGTMQLKVQYKYDALGNRLERTEDSDGNGSVDVTDRFGYDGANVWADLTGANGLNYRRLFGEGVDNPVARITPAGTVVWYLTDYQNSVIGMVDYLGASLGSKTYDGFGNILTNTLGANDDRFGFTSREWDLAVSLQYSRARYYGPGLGKWTSVDPLGFAAGDANLYRYVANEVTYRIDPTGLDGKPAKPPKPVQVPPAGPGPPELPGSVLIYRPHLGDVYEVWPPGTKPKAKPGGYLVILPDGTQIYYGVSTGYYPIGWPVGSTVYVIDENGKPVRPPKVTETYPADGTPVKPPKGGTLGDIDGWKGPAGQFPPEIKPPRPILPPGAPVTPRGGNDPVIPK
jgi:RHS repeat-associated protein